MQLAAVTRKHFLTSSAVNRKSYSPPWLVGSIKSLIRWISAPRCCILWKKKKKEVTTRTNLSAPVFAGVCLKSDYGEREARVWKSIADSLCITSIFWRLSPWGIQHDWISAKTLNRKKISTPPFFTVSLIPLLSHLQSRKLPSNQTCIIQPDCRKNKQKKPPKLLYFVAPSLNISLFFGD